MSTDAKDPSAASPTRRRLLIAGSTMAALGAGGTVWIGSRLDGRIAWIESVVRAELPGVQLDPQSLGVFAAQFAERREFDAMRWKLAMSLDQAVPVIAHRVQKSQRRIEQLKRRVLTEYLLGSNFFRVPDPRQELIIYSAAIPACGNPFAVFRDA
jgi:hypothetical protein